MAPKIRSRITAFEEWRELEGLLDTHAPWKKGLPFLNGITTDDRAAYQGYVQGYQLALDVIDSFVNKTPAPKMPAETYTEK